ncbi:MAG: ATP-binding cassette domain-containing protein [Nitrospirota bacterium]
MIKTEDLKKVYSSGVKAVDNLSFNVEKGEIFGFLGPNGAGKSSTIKMLTTLSLPTSGRAFVGGYDIIKESVRVRMTIGYVAQETGVDYCLTGRENLVLQGHFYRMDRKNIKKRTDELLDFFGLSKNADMLVSTYSGGMRRKLDIATALIHNPRLLFLDEPSLGLDIQTRHSLWNYIREINKNFEVTLFLTTHYLEEADKLANRVGIIDEGRIMVIGSPEELKDKIKGDSINLSFDTMSGSLQMSHENAKGMIKSQPYVRDVLSEGESIRIYVENGGEAIPKVANLLSSNKIEVKSLTLSRPTLDDVFLKYTGKSMTSQADDTSSGDQWWTKWQKKGSGSWGAGSSESNSWGEGESSETKGEWDDSTQWKEGDWSEKEKKWNNSKNGEWGNSAQWKKGNGEGKEKEWKASKGGWKEDKGKWSGDKNQEEKWKTSK